jgi:hypothetical protein
MIGKRKAHVSISSLRSFVILIGIKDVQFFREASDVQFDETGNRKRKYRYGDEDEIELEQQERKRRQILNKEFKAFAEKIAEAASTSVSRICMNDDTAAHSVCRLETPSKLIYLSESYRLKVYPTEQMYDYSQRQNVWCTCQILRSWS